MYVYIYVHVCTEGLITHLCMEISPLMHQGLIRKCWWTYLT